jgi:hypothetical protein
MYLVAPCSGVCEGQRLCTSTGFVQGGSQDGWSPRQNCWCNAIVLLNKASALPTPLPHHNT